MSQWVVMATWPLATTRIGLTQWVMQKSTNTSMLRNLHVGHTHTEVGRWSATKGSDHEARAHDGVGEASVENEPRNQEGVSAGKRVQANKVGVPQHKAAEEAPASFDVGATKQRQRDQTLAKQMDRRFALGQRPMGCVHKESQNGIGTTS